MDFDRKKLLPVLIGIHMVALPMYTRLPPYVLLLIVAFTIWTLLIISGRVQQPVRFIRILLAAAVVMSLIVSYGTIFGQMPGTSMVLMLSFLKLFEMKQKSDVLMVVFLGYFLIASNFFNTQSPWIAVYVFIVVIYLTSLLISFSDRLSTTTIQSRVRLSLRMVLQAIPLMLVLFILFPRLSGPLWSLPKDSKSASTGVGDEMTPGSINDLISSGAVAFRVQFEGEVPEPKDLYWRGLVLSHYDGRTWHRNDLPVDTRLTDIFTFPETKIIKYTVNLEPHGRRWLYSLENLLTNDSGYVVTRERQVVSRDKIDRLVSYSMQSGFGVLVKGLYSDDRVKNLQLPEGVHPHTLSWAKELRQKSGSDQGYINSVLNYFRAEGFVYTLTPPLLGDNAMDDFLFNTRQGFCEHYSSAFVYLMRAADIPARVVVGYQGGTINPLDNYMIVRQSDAHAWAEVWLQDKGWTRFDPTSVVSPGRIEHGITNAGLEEDRLPSFLVSENSLLMKMRFQLDSFNHNWNKWVIGFNDKKQRELFEMLGFRNIEKSKLFLWMVIIMTLSGALVALWVFAAKGKKGKEDIAAYYYSVFCKKLEKSGLVKIPSESADEFLVRAVEVLPEQERMMRLITYYYHAARYGRIQIARKNKFVSLVKAFRVA